MSKLKDEFWELAFPSNTNIHFNATFEIMYRVWQQFVTMIIMSLLNFHGGV